MVILIKSGHTHKPHPSVFLISLYGTPLAQRASYLALHNSPVAQLGIITLSLTALPLC